MVPVPRPDSWNLPLFLHVLGAVILFGGTIAVTALTVGARRRQALAPALARSAFRAWLFVVVPAFVLMRATAEWILSREKKAIPRLDHKSWVGVGFVVTDF